MLANIRKSQREDEGWFSNTLYYVLDAELELDPEEQHILERAGILDKVIFDSENVEHYGDATEESAASVADSASNIGYQEWVETKDEHATVAINAIASFYTSLWYVAQSTYYLGHTAYNAIQWTSAFQLTVRGMLEGTHFESENHDEVLKAESLIRAAVDNLKTHIDALKGFDGRDNLIEPD